MYVSSKKAQEFYKVSGDTLRLWANAKKIPYTTTKGGHRRYRLEKNIINEPQRLSFIYARVSSYKQKNDLRKQIEFIQQKFPNYKVLYDIGSGIKFNRPKFKTILEAVLDGKVKEIVVANKDRLSRFSFEFIQFICNKFKTKITVLDDITNKSPNQELADDLMSIITVFSARYYGMRRYNVLQKNKDIS